MSVPTTLIDNLSYTYFSNTNKLQAVSDPTGDQKLGDFTDKNTTSSDYGYDVNGNLLTDLNKRMNGTTGIDMAGTTGAITYNHLNLPYQIKVRKDDNTADKGMITYIYDAMGNKLEKRVLDNTNTTQPNKTTSYLGSFIYEDNALQFFSHDYQRC